MKKKFLISVLMVLLMLLMIGCSHTHQFGEWIVEKASTCTENGLSVRACKECGEKETKEIPAQGHNYVNGVCTICNEKE